MRFDTLDSDGACCAGEPDTAPRTSFHQTHVSHDWRRASRLLGPAFIASIAYVDPGNFATNVAAGARYGSLLIWVVLVANLIGMVVQILSAKLGVATGKDLPVLCRERLPRWAAFGMWVQAELIAMATDLAEFIGAAIALNLLFGMPMLVAGFVTAVVAFAILEIQRLGVRWFELAISTMLAFIVAGFLYEALRSKINVGSTVSGFVPSFAGGGSVLLGCGIIGATVMPHVVYLHSSLTKAKIGLENDADRRSVFRIFRNEVVVAMSLAGIVNILMLVVAAALFHRSGYSQVDTLTGAHAGLERLVGGFAALTFAAALLASGLASSSVGTQAGQVIMEGFIGRKGSTRIRRLVTMVPALAVIALRVNPSHALVLSQVVLSFGIPFAVIPLVWLTSKPDVMGALVNRRLTTIVSGGLASVIVALNVFLLAQTFAGGT